MDHQAASLQSYTPPISTIVIDPSLPREFPDLSSSHLFPLTVAADSFPDTKTIVHDPMLPVSQSCGACTPVLPRL